MTLLFTVQTRCTAPTAATSVATETSGLWPLRGFTLIELMVTLVVFGILLTVGVPAFREFTMTNAMAARVNAFVSDLTYVRNEAIKRNGQPTVAQS